MSVLDNRLESEVYDMAKKDNFEVNPQRTNLINTKLQEKQKVNTDDYDNLRGSRLR